MVSSDLEQQYDKHNPSLNKQLSNLITFFSGKSGESETKLSLHLHVCWFLFHVCCWKAISKSLFIYREGCVSVNIVQLTLKVSILSSLSKINVVICLCIYAYFSVHSDCSSTRKLCFRIAEEFYDCIPIVTADIA